MPPLVHARVAPRVVVYAGRLIVSDSIHAEGNLV